LPTTWPLAGPGARLLIRTRVEADVAPSTTRRPVRWRATSRPWSGPPHGPWTATRMG